MLGKASRRKLVTLLSAASLLWSQIVPAYAVIDNEITVSGTSSLGQPVIVSDTAIVDVEDADPELQLVKNGVLDLGVNGTADPGDIINYTFDLTNSGNITIENLTVDDPDIGFTSSVIPTLAPGDMTQVTTTYAITATDIANGQFANTATATGTPRAGTLVDPTGSFTVPIIGLSSLSLIKTAVLDDGGDGRADVNDEITYTFTVTNTGQTTLTNVSVSDPRVDVAALEGNARTFALLNAVKGGVDITQTASIEPDVKPVTLASTTIAPPYIPTDAHVSRSVINLNGNMDDLQPGNQVAVIYDIINSGDAPLVDIIVEQGSDQPFNPKLDLLAPQARDASSILFVHSLTEEEIANGQIETKAQLTAKSRGQTLSKDIAAPIQLSELRSIDQLTTAVINPTNVPTLAPNATADFTVVYQLTQDDIDDGNVTNTATANATGPSGPVSDDSHPTDPNLDGPTIVPLIADPQIALVKTHNIAPAASMQAGSPVTYTFTVTNPGNVTLDSVAISDAPLGIGVPINLVASAATSDSKLQPGEAWTYTANYTVSQSNMDAGEVENQASVSSLSPTNVPTLDVSDDDLPTEDEPTNIPLSPTPRIALVKTAGTIVDANSNGFADVGENLTYTFTVTNPGNVTLNTVSIADAPLGLGTPINLVASPATADSLLQPGETWTYTAIHSVTQANINAGTIQNQATVSGAPPVGSAVSDLSDNNSPNENDPTNIAVTQRRGVALLKTQTSFTDVNTNGFVEQGDTINYTITVRNTGSVTITSATVTDPGATLVGGTISDLAPGASTILTASRLVSATEAAVGQVSNQAFITGTTQTAGPVSDSSDFDPAIYTLATSNRPTLTPVQRLAIAIVKPSPIGFNDTNDNDVQDAGDTLTYSFTVTNRGTVPLGTISAVDLLPGTTTVNYVSGDTANPNILDLTETWTFQSTYTLLATDITLGRVENQARVSGQAGAPTPLVVTDDSDNNSPTENDKTITLVGTPDVALVKNAGTIADTNESGIQDAGDTITYTFMVTNTGAIPLTAIAVTDTKVGPITGSPIANLAVGASNTAPLTAKYTITRDDVRRGFVENHASVTAQSARGPVTDLSDDSELNEDDPTRTFLVPSPRIAIIKTIKSVTDVNGNKIDDVGDVINYTFAITNTGNVTLTNVTVADPNATVSGGPIASLAPGNTNSSAIKGSHTITIADAKSGKVVNQATAQGRTNTNTVVSDVSDGKSLNGNSPTVIRVFLTPPTVTKVASRSEVRRGESVTYTITATDMIGLRSAIRDVMPPSFIYDEDTATANGVESDPRVNGNTLTFTGYTPDATGRVTIKLKLIAGANLGTGKYINTAQVVNRDNGAVIATGTATVEIKTEHVFDCGEIIGRVFEDRNGNGYADDGEPGIPGVRVVTVNGLVITSDAKGRFHIACADIPNSEIGSNFVVKLDLTSLPDGFVLTTENPRDVRLTRGKVTKLNFGAKRSCDVRLDIRRDAFIGDTTKLKPKWADGLNDLTSVLEQCPGKLNIVYRCGQYAPIADARLQALESALQSRWTKAGAPYGLDISSRVECGK